MPAPCGEAVENALAKGQKVSAESVLEASDEVGLSTLVERQGANFGLASINHGRVAW